MPGLLKRIKSKQKPPPPVSPAKLERLRRAKWGNDLYDRLCGEGNAYDGALQIVAKGKTAGTYSPDIDPDDKQALKAERAAKRFKLNRQSTKKLVTKLAKRVNGSADVEATRPRLSRAVPIEVDTATEAKVAKALKKTSGGKCDRIRAIALALPDLSIPQLKAALAPHGFNGSTVGIQAAAARSA